MKIYQVGKFKTVGVIKMSHMNNIVFFCALMYLLTNHIMNVHGMVKVKNKFKIIFASLGKSVFSIFYVCQNYITVLVCDAVFMQWIIPDKNS